MPFDLPKMGKDGLSASQAPYAVQLRAGKVLLCTTLAETDAIPLAKIAHVEDRRKHCIIPHAKIEKRHQNYEKRQRH